MTVSDFISLLCDKDIRFTLVRYGVSYSFCASETIYDNVPALFIKCSRHAGNRVHAIDYTSHIIYIGELDVKNAV